MFYTFRQNNSGGSFVNDENLKGYVIVEANSAGEANEIAESIGIYFGGYGDCPCCGDRWSMQWDGEEGTEIPSVYDTPVFEFKGWRKNDVIVHYLDGHKEIY